MGDELLGDFRPGTTWLHRLSPGPKLIALATIAVVLVSVRQPWLALGALVVAIGLARLARLGAAHTVRTLRRIALVALLLGAWLVWQKGWPRALDTVGDLATLFLLASVLTTTTAVDDLLDTITRSLEPFRRVGVNPEKVSLAFSLMLRAIPSTIEVANQTRDAAIARGLQRNPRARLTPLVIRVVAQARETGDALHARGIGDD